MAVLSCLPQPTMRGSATCRISGYFLPRLYDIHLISDILLIGSDPSKPEEVEHLDGASVVADTKSVTVDFPTARSLVLKMQSVEEAQQWSAALSEASKIANNLRTRLCNSARIRAQTLPVVLENGVASMTQQSEPESAESRKETIVLPRELGASERSDEEFREVGAGLWRKLELCEQAVEELEEKRTFVQAIADHVQEAPGFPAATFEEMKAIRAENASLRAQLKAAAVCEAEAKLASIASLDAVDTLKKENEALLLETKRLSAERNRKREGNCLSACFGGFITSKRNSPKCE
eukprot:TRINITY_DN63096_c0_g1_i1.p1 TRINITY_DN63096_c0_g1~~TRINITY_DN63096_c0_g1_i1.p1  ORF type:complete len:293 (+),score=55.94 TRINITY_DN63096_c0_g1_i1:70-948(+)